MLVFPAPIWQVWLSCWTNCHEYAKTGWQDLFLVAGGVMPKMVIEVPEEFAEVGKAMAAHRELLASVRDSMQL